MKKQFIITLVITLMAAYQGIAQEWLVPDEQKGMTNPSEYNLSNVKKGKDLYMKNCKSCHGDPGKHNGLPLVPPPPDMISEQMQKNTDGEMFYKITKGRGGMPQFETMISEDDRWRLINFIRNFDPSHEQLLVDAPPQKAKLLASVNEVGKKVEIFAEVETKDGSYVKLPNAAVKISAKKAFGNLPIGEILTNADGRAEYSIPETLIGDENGMVNIVVQLDEGYVTDHVILDAAKVGQLKPQPKLIRKEILWSTNENIQTWLLLSYLAAVGGAWLAIGYVVFQITRIRRLGKE
ncbi:MAG: c-type cytochrome [Draconibacterium sp.]